MKPYYYLGNLAPELLPRWPDAANSLPPLAELAYLISVAYQASLL